MSAFISGQPIPAATLSIVIPPPAAPPDPPPDAPTDAPTESPPIDAWPDSVWLTVGRRLGASPVQLAIMRLMLVEELSNESIAHALGRSRMSVDTQISRLYKKVGVKTRVGLVKRVYGVHSAGVIFNSDSVQ